MAISFITIRNGLGYYLVFNHLYAIVHRFGADGLTDEDVMLRRIEAKLTALRAAMEGPSVALIDVLLQSDSLPCKANLLTRIEDRDELESEYELAVYTSVANPLARRCGEEATDRAGRAEHPVFAVCEKARG